MHFAFRNFEISVPQRLYATEMLLDVLKRKQQSESVLQLPFANPPRCQNEDACALFPCFYA